MDKPYKLEPLNETNFITDEIDWVTQAVPSGTYVIFEIDDSGSFCVYVDAFTCSDLIPWDSTNYYSYMLECVSKCEPSDFDMKNYASLPEIIKQALIKRVLDTSTSIYSMEGCRMTGSIFNQFLDKFDIKLFKLTNETEIHNSMQFVTGYNEDPLVFDTKSYCSPGGIYLTDAENLKHWIVTLGDIKWIRSAKIPDDALVFIEPNGKIKVSHVILGERTTAVAV